MTNAALTVQSSLESVQASDVARELAQKKLEAAQSKFEVGMSTNYEVVQAQRDFARRAERWTCGGAQLSQGPRELRPGSDGVDVTWRLNGGLVARAVRLARSTGTTSPTGATATGGTGATGVVTGPGGPGGSL